MRGKEGGEPFAACPGKHAFILQQSRRRGMSNKAAFVHTTAITLHPTAPANRRYTSSAYHRQQWPEFRGLSLHMLVSKMSTLPSDRSSEPLNRLF